MERLVILAKGFAKITLNGLRDLIILIISDSVTFLMLKASSIVLTAHCAIAATESIKNTYFSFLTIGHGVVYSNSANSLDLLDGVQWKMAGEHTS